jgi:hypothetical protein
MSRATTTCIAILLLLTPLIVAQETSKTPNSEFPADVVPAQQLIAWSWMQQPQPTPQPAPPRDTTLPQPGPQAAPSKVKAVQTTPNQDVTGRIVPVGNR